MIQPAPARSTSGDTAPAAEAVRLAGLGNRFVELFARKLSREDLAAEIARLIAAATRVKAAAILGLDARRDRLRLLGEAGLSSDARAALGGGGDCVWDIPLRGLRNRRISVISAAHQNPFVPRGLVNLSPTGLSIASMPIYDEREPIGVLLLMATGSRAFPDAQLQVLSQALRVCARGLRDHDTPAARAGAAARDTATIAAAIAELAGETPGATAVEVTGAPRPVIEAPPDERIQRLEEQLAQVREELERSALKLRSATVSSNALVRERDHLGQRVAEMESERAAVATELRAEIDVLQERLLAVESERSRYQRVADDRHTRAQQSIKVLGGERDMLLGRVQAAESTISVLDGALGTVKAERARLTFQVGNLVGQLRASQEALERAQSRHAEERTVIESDREGWQEQADTLRSQLTQRTEEVAALDRELRGTTVGRDGALAQLQAARAELERLTVLNEETGRALSASETARASAAAESAALRHAFEAERAEQSAVEQQLRSELSVLHADANRLSSELEGMRSGLDTRTQALAARDELLARVRAELARAQDAEATWLQTGTAQRAEIATLTAKLEQLTEVQQQLLGERGTLRTAVAESRQQATEADVAHAAAMGELQSAAAQLRRQVETLTVDRVALAGRLERAVEEGKTLGRGLAETQRRSDDLSELLRQRDAAAERAAAEREQLAAQVAALSGQLQAGQEAWQRAQARDAQERSALETDRDGWKEQASAVRKELTQATDRVIALEAELRGTVVARDAAVTELQTASAEMDRIAILNDELGHQVAQLEAAHAAAVVENTGLRRTLDEERGSRANTEQTLQRTLAVTQADAERLGADAAALRTEVAEYSQALADRDQQLTGLHTEIELLRQQSVDRGVLAHQANELGAKVVVLEQELAAARGEGARAERQRAALAEKLEAGRRRETERLTVATREQAALQESRQALATERDRLQADKAAQGAESEAQQQTISELQSALERLRSERTRVQDEQHDTARRLAATQRQLDELTAALRQREAEVATHSGERQRLAAQLDTIRREVEGGRQALQAAEARATQERAALDSEREAWQEQLAAARTEQERQARMLDELGRTATDLAAARTASRAERAALVEALETERTTAQQLRDDRAALHAEVERLAADTAGLRAVAAERDEQLVAVQERETALQHSATELQHAITELRTERETQITQLDERAAQIQQLRDGQAALERQLALVMATHGEEEQALANGMQAAREQVAQLEEERNVLRAALTDVRQQLGTAQTGQTARLTEMQAEAIELRKQIKSLTSGRTELIKRLERSEQSLAGQREHAEGERRRAETLDAQVQQLQQQLAAIHNERAAADAELVRARGEIDRLAKHVQDGTAEREHWRTAHSALERQLTQLSASSSEHERALGLQLEAALVSGAQLEQERTALQSTLADLEQRLQQAATAHAAALAEVQVDAEALHEQVTAARSARDVVSEQLAQAQQMAAIQSAQVDTESRRAAALAEQNGQLQQALAAAEQRHAALDGVLKQARAEIEALRQQSEDRGLLAREASELGARVVALEQQLVGVRGEAAHAERQRAAVAQELDAVCRQQADSEARAGREQAKLQATVERLGEERRRLESEQAARAAEVEAQRVAVAELQTAVTRAGETGQAAAQRLADTQQRADELLVQLRQRETAIETANGERQRLAAQVAKLSAQSRASQETLDAVQGRSALERAAIEAEREAFAAQQSAGRAEQQRLVALTEELTQQAAQLESGRATAATEIAALRRSVDELRAAHQLVEETLRAEVAASQSHAQHVSSDLLGVRGELAERDELLALLWQEQDAARQTDVQHQQTIASLRAELVAAQAAVHAEVQRAADENQQLRDARATVERQLALIEAARGEEGQVLAQGLQAARTQIAELEQERADAHTALAEIRQRLALAEAVHADTQARIQADAAELRQQVATLTDARSTLAQRVEQTEQTLRQHSAHAEAESQRAHALTERCAELEQSLAAVESQRTTLDKDVRRLNGEVEALRHDSADRGVLARQAGELNSALTALEQQLAEMRREAAHAEQQRVALGQELEAARQEQSRTRAAAAQQETTLQAMLQQLTDERAQLVSERTTQQHQLETQRITVAELQAALEQTQAERQRVEDDGRDTAQRLADVHRRLDELGERVRQRDAALELAAAERQRLEEAVRAADAQIAELSSECDAWRQRAESAAADDRGSESADDAGDFVVRMERDSGAPPADAPLVIERSAPLDALLDATPEPADTPLEPEPEPAAHETIRLAQDDTIRLAQEMVLLDASGRGDEAYHVLKGAGFEVTRGTPNEAAVDDLATRKVSCVMLNLAAGPAAWRTLKLLRERTGTRNVPVLAYLMAPDSQQGFCFGRADFGIWPMDGERLTERLTQLRPKLKRLLAVSADIDGMGRLREPLTRAGISTSSVLDGKQALEFATMVEPEAALFHLSPTCSGVARAITALRAGERTRDMPMVMLLDKAPAREDTFYAITARELISKGTFVFANLPAELARLLA